MLLLVLLVISRQQTYGVSCEPRENSDENIQGLLAKSQLVPAAASISVLSRQEPPVLLNHWFLRGRMAASRHIGDLDCVPGERLAGKES